MYTTLAHTMLYDATCLMYFVLSAGSSQDLHEHLFA